MITKITRAAMALCVSSLSMLWTVAYAGAPAVNQGAYSKLSSGVNATFYVATSSRTMSYNAGSDGSLLKQPAIMVGLVMASMGTMRFSINDVKWLPPTQYPKLAKVLWDFTGQLPNLAISVSSPLTKYDAQSYTNWAVDYLVRLSADCYSPGIQKIVGFKFNPMESEGTQLYWFVGDYQVQFVFGASRIAVITNEITNQNAGIVSAPSLGGLKTDLAQQLIKDMA